MRLSDWLSTSGMNPTQFARQAGVAHTTVLRILAGNYHPQRDTRRRIVNATGGEVTEAELLVEAALGGRALLEQAPVERARKSGAV